VQRIRAEDHLFVAVVAVTAVGYLLASSPLVGTDNAGWARHIVADTPRQIWASSHFGQVLNYLVLEGLAWLDPAVTAFTAMRLVSYGMGLLYVAALALLATTSPGRGRIAFFIIGALSPLTVFLHGEEEIPYYPFPVLLLVAALWRRAGRAQGVKQGGALSALGGLAAAFHGVGLFFLPGIAALGWGTGSARRSAHERVRATLDSMVMFFGPTGALFVFYVLAFPVVSIFPGDAGGGGQRTLFVPLFGTIAAFHEFRAYSFFSLTHLQDVALLVVMGAPALLVLAAWAVARGRSVAMQDLSSASSDQGSRQRVSHWRITSLDPPRLMAALVHHGVATQPLTDAVDVEVAGDVAASELLAVLVGDGIPITAFAPSYGALETAYLAATEDRQ